MDNPWGITPKTKNRFQEKFIEIVESVETEDWEHVKWLMEDLTSPQRWDIWWKLASYTRTAMKEHNCIKMDV